MRRCRTATVALLVALTAVLAVAPLARAQTTSVLPTTATPAGSTATPGSTTGPGSSATPGASTTTPPASTATAQTTAAPQNGASTATPASSGTTRDHDSKLPVLLLAIIGAILLAAALAIAAARWWAYDPPWLIRARHSTAEAGWRTSAAWAEFRDWVRLGR